MVRQVGDGWRNADAGACQHWRPGCSAPGQIRWCAAVQTLVNCHCKLEENPVGNVEPMQLVVQYLHTAIKLPSAGDNAQQRATPAVICPLLSLVQRPGRCYSNPFESVASERVKSPATAGYAGVDEVGKSSPRRHERRDDRRSDPERGGT